MVSQGFTDENSKWLTPAKRKRKLDQAESEDDSDEHWEEEGDYDEEKAEVEQPPPKAGKNQAKMNTQLGMKELEEDDGDDDDDDEEMVDDYGALDEEESDGEEVREIKRVYLMFRYFLHDLLFPKKKTHNEDERDRKCQSEWIILNMYPY